MPTQTRVFAPYAATEPHGVGDRAARRVYMRCAECGVLPVACRAHGVSPKTRPAGGPGGCGATAGTRGMSRVGMVVGDRHVGALPPSGSGTGAVSVASGHGLETQVSLLKERGGSRPRVALTGSIGLAAEGGLESRLLLLKERVGSRPPASGMRASGMRASGMR